MSETRQEQSPKKRGRGRAKLPAGERRSVWIGAHVTEAKRLELQARAAKERPGKTFADWLVACAEAGAPENRGKSSK